MVPVTHGKATLPLLLIIYRQSYLGNNNTTISR